MLRSVRGAGQDGAFTQDQLDIAQYLSAFSPDRINAILEHPDADLLNDLAIEVYGMTLIEVIAELVGAPTARPTVPADTE